MTDLVTRPVLVARAHFGPLRRRVIPALLLLLIVFPGCVDTREGGDPGSLTTDRDGDFGSHVEDASDRIPDLREVGDIDASDCVDTLGGPVDLELEYLPQVDLAAIACVEPTLPCRATTDACPPATMCRLPGTWSPTTTIVESPDGGWLISNQGIHIKFAPDGRAEWGVATRLFSAPVVVDDAFLFVVRRESSGAVDPVLVAVDLEGRVIGQRESSLQSFDGVVDDGDLWLYADTDAPALVRVSVPEFCVRTTIAVDVVASWNSSRQVHLAGLGDELIILEPDGLHAVSARDSSPVVRRLATLRQSDYSESVVVRFSRSAEGEIVVRQDGGWVLVDSSTGEAIALEAPSVPVRSTPTLSPQGRSVFATEAGLFSTRFTRDAELLEYDRVESIGLPIRSPTWLEDGSALVVGPGRVAHVSPEGEPYWEYWRSEFQTFTEGAIRLSDGRIVTVADNALMIIDANLPAPSPHPPGMPFYDNQNSGRID